MRIALLVVYVAGVSGLGVAAFLSLRYLSYGLRMDAKETLGLAAMSVSFVLLWPIAVPVFLLLANGPPWKK